MTVMTRDQIICNLKSPDPAKREEAVLEIANLGDSSLLPHLLEVLPDPLARVRWRVIQTMGHLSAAAEVVEPVVRYLRDESALVRGEAVKLVGEACDPRYLDFISHLLEDDDPRVRYRAIEAVGEIGVAREQEMNGLLRYLEEEDFRIRMHAAIALGKCRCKKGLSALVRALRDPNPNVRGFAAWALGMLEDHGAIEPLIETLADGGESVRTRAYQAIAGFGEAAIPGLRKALEQGPAELRPLVQGLLDQVLG